MTELIDVTNAEETQIGPKARVLKLEDGKAEVQDARDRIIVVSKLNALSLYRLTKTLGASASNAATADIAMLAASVRKIDTVEFAAPTKEADIEFVIQKLDFEGLAAVGEGLKQLSAQTQAGIESSKN